MRLRSPVVFILGTVSARKTTDQNHSDNESADMRPPCDSAGVGTSGGQSCRSVKELHHEPEPEHDQSRYFNDLDEDKNGYQRRHARAWIRQEIRYKHARNCAAGADAGNDGVDVEDSVNDSGADAAKQIEHEIREMTETVFHVVAENPEVPHVPDQMHPASMQEHGCQKGQ